MPAWVDTDQEEKAWKRAKAIVREQRDKKEKDFTDRDWGLVTTIAKNILKSATLSGSNGSIIYKLSKVEAGLKAIADKRKLEASLPDSTQEQLRALKNVMRYGGQAIAKIRNRQTRGKSLNYLSASVTDDLERLADKLKAFVEDTEQ